jgi:hypothetical protein
MSTNITIHNSATKIILNYLKTNKINNSTIAIPSNICEKIVISLGRNNKLLSIPINKKDHFINQNYLKKNLKLKDIKVVILVYPYGNYNKNTYKNLKKLIAQRKILLIEDFCLCDPIKIIKKIKSIKNSFMVFSTGYSKFIDLKKGGFAIYDNNLLKYKVFNKKRFEIFYKKKYFIKPEIFKLNKINYNKYLKIIFKVRNKRIIHSTKINKIYKKLKDLRSIKEIKGDWRYSFEVLSKKKFNNIKKIKFSKSIFFGFNYPDILRLKKYHKFFVKKKYSPNKNIINLFNDFRYDSLKAKKTYQAIIKQL